MYQSYCNYIFNKEIYALVQVRSQDRIWGGTEPPPKKSGPFGPKKWTLLTSPPKPSYKNPIFGPLCSKKWTFCQIWGVHHTPAPPGYGPALVGLLS